MRELSAARGGGPDAPEEPPRSPFRFVPAGGFEAPSASVSEQARSGIGRLVGRLLGLSDRPETGTNCETFAVLTAEESAGLVAEPPARELRDALAAALSGWPPAEGGAALRLVLTAPHGPAATAVSDLARAEGIPVLEAPDGEALLRGDRAVLDALRRREGEALAIPRLEGFFLRDPRVLPRVRELLGRLALRRAPTLIGCGSWAFSWLRAALGLDRAFPEPFALAALGAEALASWLGRPAAGPLACREPGGRFVLWPGEGAPPGEGSPFLQELAAASRGNPGVAAALFSHALRRAPEDAFADVALPGVDRRCLVVPFRELAPPSLRRKAGPAEVAVLHTLLLHGGLPTPVLHAVLPFADGELERSLAGLRGAGLLEEEGAGWQVTAAGYPAVRELLRGAGLPPDDL